MRASLLILALLLACIARGDELTRAVQEQLKAQGTYSGPLDGNPSAEFTDALKAYQQQHNLPASGRIDRATAKVLDDESGMALGPAKTSPAHKTAPPPPLQASPSLSPRIPSPSPTPTLTQSATPPPPPSSPALQPTTPSPSPTASPILPPQNAAVSPAATSPSPAAALPPQFSVERITKFLHDYMHAGEGKTISPQLRYFLFPVNYFGHDAVDARFVRNDLLRYMRRWPVRHYMLTEPVKILPASPETVTVDFTIAFSVQKGKRRASGRTSNRVTLREVNGQLKIVGIEEQRVPD